MYRSAERRYMRGEPNQAYLFLYKQRKRYKQSRLNKRKENAN